jgi:saccharopine dehydrogenase-like NADP-dependent oxidoreductase
MARIVVLGGNGFLGSRVVEGLRRAKADVSVASRRSEVVVDVTRPETFSALAPFDVVVDLSDTVSHPPDALIAWCLSQGKTVIEATSDARCVERLQKLQPTRGRLVLGGGIFTGVSNLVCQQASSEVGTAESITLGIDPTASFPFLGWSGACASAGTALSCTLTPTGGTVSVSARFSSPGIRD